jgi:hypothetical protein
MQDAKGNSSLHTAAKRGILSLVQTLLEFNANPDVVNCKGRTPHELTDDFEIKRVLRVREIYIDQEEFCLVEPEREVGKKRHSNQNHGHNHGQKFQVLEARNDEEKSGIVEQLGQTGGTKQYIYIFDGAEAFAEAGLSKRPSVNGCFFHEDNNIVCPVLVSRLSARPIIRKVARFLSAKLHHHETKNPRQQFLESLQHSQAGVDAALPALEDADRTPIYPPPLNQQSTLTKREAPTLESEESEESEDYVVPSPFFSGSQGDSPYSELCSINPMEDGKEALRSSPMNNTSGNPPYQNMPDQRARYSLLHQSSATESMATRANPTDYTLLTQSLGELPSVSEHRLVNLLQDLGLSKYIDVFLAEEWDWDSLLEITNNDLTEMGIKAGSRRKLISAISRLQQERDSLSHSSPVAPLPTKIDTAPRQRGSVDGIGGCSYLIDASEIRFLDYLGKGFYGSVYRGTWNRFEVAIKEVSQPSDGIEKWVMEVELLQ